MGHYLHGIPTEVWADKKGSELRGRLSMGEEGL